jgi:hypothetical protein
MVSCSELLTLLTTDYSVQLHAPVWPNSKTDSGSMLRVVQRQKNPPPHQQDSSAAMKLPIL